MTELTIEITRHCIYECDYCSSDSIPNGPHLDKKKIFKFLDEQKKNEDIDRINISGGEPLAHPDFYEILYYCYSITKNVWVYTNALTQIIFNADIIDEIKVEANVCVAHGKRLYIPKNVNRVHLLKLVRQGKARSYPEQKITASGNFFHERKCEDCNHVTLQADGKITTSPCKKTYEKCELE